MDLHLNLESLDTTVGKSHNNFEMSDESSEWEDDPILFHQQTKKENMPDELSLNLDGIESDSEKEPGGLLPFGNLYSCES